MNKTISKDTLFDLLKTNKSENIKKVKKLSEENGIPIKDLLIDYFELYGAPYFKVLKNGAGFPKEMIHHILARIFGPNIIVRGKEIRHKHLPWRTSKLYSEGRGGSYWTWEYDEQGRNTFHSHTKPYTNVYGYWVKNTYVGDEMHKELHDGMKFKFYN